VGEVRTSPKQRPSNRRTCQQPYQWKPHLTGKCNRFKGPHQKKVAFHCCLGRVPVLCDIVSWNILLPSAIPVCLGARGFWRCAAGVLSLLEWPNCPQRLQQDKPADYRKDNSAQVWWEKAREKNALCGVSDNVVVASVEVGVNKLGIWRRRPQTRFRLGAEKTENRRPSCKQVIKHTVIAIPRYGCPKINLDVLLFVLVFTSLKAAISPNVGNPKHRYSPST